MLLNVSKTNQIKVIPVLLIILNLIFFIVPLDEYWDEAKEEYYPFYIYENDELIVIHLTFLICIIFNAIVKFKIVKYLSLIIILVFASLYCFFALMHRTTMSWTVLGSPFLSVFLPLILYRIYLIKKLKE